MPAPLPFCNNLKKDDEVWHTVSKRRGVVHMQPRPTAIRVSVILDDIETARYFPLEELRLLVDGKIAEDVPPCDGEIPKPAAAPAAAPANSGRAPAGLTSEPDDSADSERVLEAARNLAEHFDAVEILVTRRDGDGSTRTIAKGCGNWHARLGVVREWLLNTEEQIREEGREIARGED